MVVTLKVVSYQKNVLGSDAHMQFDSQGGSFGRAEDNDWVLPDPERIISSRHGLVGYRDGEFWITDCSTNGIYIGDKSALLGKGKSVPLHHGDRLIMGEYEVEVGLEAERRDADAVPADTGAANPDSALDRNDFINEPQFDPLEALGGGAGNSSGSFRMNSQRASAPGAMSNHSSPMHDAFSVPDSANSRDGFESAGIVEPIPEDWDMTGFQTPPARKQAPSQFDAYIEDPFLSTADSQKTDVPGIANGKARVNSGVETPQPLISGPAQPAIPDPPVIPERPAGPVRHDNSDPNSIRPQKHASTPTDSASTATDSASRGAGPVPAQARPGSDGEDLVRGFLTAAGLNPALFDSIDPADAMTECGHLFGDLLQGMMELLRARSETKNEFRMSLTTVRSSENNPLKFTINASEVLRILLVDKPPGYLAADAAVAEGVNDLRDHQLAMIAGMQVAFASLVQRLNPNRFSNADEQKSWVQSLLPLADKAGAWDNYRRFYADTASSDRAFQKLFGDIFAQAYEEQSQRLRFESRK